MKLDSPVSNYSYLNAIIVNEDDTIADVIKNFTMYNIQHMPVIKENIGITGIVSSHEIIEAICKKGDLSVLKDPISLYMKRNVMVCDQNQTIKDAILMLYYLKIDAIPIVEDNNIIGILTLRDILKIKGLWAFIPDIHLTKKEIDQLQMGRDIVLDNGVNNNHSIWTSLDKLRSSKIPDFLIFDEDMRVNGLMSVYDILINLTSSQFDSWESNFYLSTVPITELNFRKPMILTEPVSLQTSRKLMLDHNENSFVLQHLDTPVSLITERDFLNYLVKHIIKAPELSYLSFNKKDQFTYIVA